MLLVVVAYVTGTDVSDGDTHKNEMETSCESTDTSTIDMCCQGRVVPKTSNTECCGAEAYDAQTHLCCAGNILTRFDSHECCGTKLYNTKWYMCCDDHVVRRAGTNACCGSHGYHTDFDICCDGQVYLKLLHACSVDGDEKPEH